VFHSVDLSLTRTTANGTIKWGSSSIQCWFWGATVWSRFRESKVPRLRCFSAAAAPTTPVPAGIRQRARKSLEFLEFLTPLACGERNQIA